MDPPAGRTAAAEDRENQEGDRAPECKARRSEGQGCENVCILFNDQHLDLWFT